MVEIIDAIIGSGIIVLNLLPFVFKKPKYLFITGLISVLILFLLIFFKTG